MMKKYFAGIIMLALLVVAPEIYAETASGIIRMNLDLSSHPQDKKVELWLPYPVSSQYQDISNIHINGDYAQSAIYTDKKYSTPILYAQWPAGTTGRHLTFSFTAQRREVARRDFVVKEAVLDSAGFAKWLQSSSLGPIDGQVKTLAESITRDKKTMLARAKAIYDWVCDNMYREPDTVGCGKGDVCALLAKPGGKCTDIHSVFVALCRAAGIPAREIFGIRLGKKSVQDISKWQHCWAEFYLPGYGWVPVDPADVRKLMLKKNLNLEAPETAELRQYFWGGWDAYRVKLAMGRDLILNPVQQGGPINTFGYPYAEVGGKPLDFYHPASFQYKFTAYQINDAGYGVIDTEGLQALLAQDGGMLVFDARNDEEYQEVHIKGALSLPVKEFAGNSHLLPADKSQMIIFYCNGIKCGKSKKAAKKALEMGYGKVLVYAEGMPVWEEKGMPLYAGPDYEKRIKTSIIAPGDLQEKMAQAPDSLTVVDVRDLEEYKEGHVPGAINIPVASFASSSEVLDKKKKIVVYCNSGGRSYNAYRKLMKLGYKDIGQAIFTDWKEAGLPVDNS